MNTFHTQLEKYKLEGRYRVIPPPNQDARMINLSSNDYLGLAGDEKLQSEFMEEIGPEKHLFSSSSARLLSGNFEAHERVESLLSKLYGSSALIFNSGYHANVGILPAITDKRSLILADKLVHASLIDGIRLAQAKSIRFRHNDYEQLEQFLETHQDNYDRIIVVTESIFSMDGDESDLHRLVELKHRYKNIMLYVDEAHAFGVRGDNGLGCAEQIGCLGDVDFIVGTFGKALASVGAYVICNNTLRDYLINTMRPFIFSTALPPVNMLWSAFVLERLPQIGSLREKLETSANRFRLAIQSCFETDQISTSHIVPVITGDSKRAMLLSRQLAEKGFHVLPVRPPSVPEGTARLRFSFSAAMNDSDLNRLIGELEKIDFQNLEANKI